MKVKAVCLKCGGVLKERSHSSGSQVIIRYKCGNQKCGAIFFVDGRSLSEIRCKVSKLYRKMRCKRDEYDAKVKEFDVKIQNQLKAGNYVT